MYFNKVNASGSSEPLVKKSSPLKLLHGLSWNFACRFLRVMTIKFMFEFLISWITLRPLLKIEHRVKTKSFAYISKSMLRMKKTVTWKWSLEWDLSFLIYIEWKVLVLFAIENKLFPHHAHWVWIDSLPFTDTGLSLWSLLSNVRTVKNINFVNC